MSIKWVISDLHFGHSNILKYSGEYRDGNTSEEHDEWLIEKINKDTKKGDLLYILGDVAMTEESLHKVKRLKPGNKILIRGNHDIYATQKYLEYFQQVYGLLSFKGTFWLSHASIHPNELRGRLNIHGHVHQKSINDNRYINACVEACGGLPINLTELFEKYKYTVYEERQRIYNQQKENL